MTPTPTYHKWIAGLGYYDGLPDGWRQAQRSDFYKDGALLSGVAYLIRNQAGEYEAYRTKALTIHEHVDEILTFVRLERVYVLD